MSTMSYRIIKAFKLPNITVPRWLKFWWQRRTRGWDDSETWSLDETIAEFVLPRLIRYKELNDIYPSNMTQEEWDIILNKIIYSFGFYASKERYTASREQYNEARDGIILFAEHFNKLWW